jgi:type I restriction enzyme, S subunit
VSDLPPGWEWTTIGEVADVQLGRQRSPQQHFGPHMRPYLRAANVTWTGLDLNDVKEMNFDPDDAAKYALAPGDILLNEASGSPNEVGKPAIWRGEIPRCCFQNTLLRIRSRGPLVEYLYWYLHHVAREGRFGQAGRGVNIRHLGKRGLTQFRMPVPPLPEQERIAAAIYEYLSRLDAADAELDSAMRKVYALERSIITEASSTTSPPAGWAIVSVAEAGDVALGLQRSPKRHAGTNMRPYLRVANVFEDRIDSSDIMTMDISDAEWILHMEANGFDGPEPFEHGYTTVQDGDATGPGTTDLWVVMAEHLRD